MPDSPFTGQFIFEVDGIQLGAFMEVHGLSVEVKVEPIEEGGQNEFVHKVPGRMSWPNLVLKRGITVDNVLFEWFQKSSGEGLSGADNKLARSTGALIMVDAGGNRLREWAFEGAFPVKWSGPDFSASSRDVATEELEIAHHGFRLNYGPWTPADAQSRSSARRALAAWRRPSGSI